MLPFFIVGGVAFSLMETSSQKVVAELYLVLTLWQAYVLTRQALLTALLTGYTIFVCAHHFLVWILIWSIRPCGLMCIIA